MTSAGKRLELVWRQSLTVSMQKLIRPTLLWILAAAASGDDLAQDAPTPVERLRRPILIYEGAAGTRTVTGNDGKRITAPAGGGVPTMKNQLLLAGEFDRQRNERTRTLSGHSPLDPFDPNYTGYQPQPSVSAAAGDSPRATFTNGSASPRSR